MARGPSHIYVTPPLIGRGGVLLDFEDLIDLDVLKPLPSAAGPSHGELVDCLGSGEAEVQAPVMMRLVAAAGADFPDTRFTAGLDPNTSAHPVAVRDRSAKVDQDPVAFAARVDDQRRRRVDLDVQFGSTVPPNAQHIVPRHNRTSYTQQWNLHVQRQLAEELMVELGYVGTRGLKLSTFSNVNTALPAPGEVQPRRPFPQYGPLSEMGNQSSSIYHGLQLKIEKRFSDGLSFRANYAFGKTIDVLGAGFSASQTAQNPHDILGDRALSDLHRAHAFTFDYVWQLPFGRGKTYGSGMNRAADAILGGWQLPESSRPIAALPSTLPSRVTSRTSADALAPRGPT